MQPAYLLWQLIDDLPALQAEEQLAAATLSIFAHLKESARKKLWRAWEGLAKRGKRAGETAGATVARSFGDIAQWFRQQGLGVG